MLKDKTPSLYDTVRISRIQLLQAVIDGGMIALRASNQVTYYGVPLEEADLNASIAKQSYVDRAWDTLRTEGAKKN